MSETIMYLLVGFGCLTIVALCNKNLDKQCEKAQGQIITHTGKLGHSCVYPVK